MDLCGPAQYGLPQGHCGSWEFEDRTGVGIGVGVSELGGGDAISEMDAVKPIYELEANLAAESATRARSFPSSSGVTSR